MIHAANPVLNQTPKALDGIGVNVAFDVDASRMFDVAMPILQWDSLIVPQKLDLFIRSQFVGVDSAAGSDVLLNERSQLMMVHSGHGLCNDLASALDNRHNRSFLVIPSWRATLAALLDAAHPGFVHFNRWPLQLQIAVRKHRANLLEHAPCGFVGDSALSLNLFSGDAAPSRPH